jgi:hypothetical protein
MTQEPCRETAPKTELEYLLTDHQRRLNTALDAPRPISVEQHHQFRESLRPSDRFDEIDEALADPRLDRLPAYRRGSEAARLEALLDSLERGEG